MALHFDSQAEQENYLNSQRTPLFEEEWSTQKKPFKKRVIIENDSSSDGDDDDDVVKTIALGVAKSKKRKPTNVDEPYITKKDGVPTTNQPNDHPIGRENVDPKKLAREIVTTRFKTPPPLSQSATQEGGKRRYDLSTIQNFSLDQFENHGYVFNPNKHAVYAKTIVTDMVDNEGNPLCIKPNRFADKDTRFVIGHYKEEKDPNTGFRKFIQMKDHRGWQRGHVATISFEQMRRLLVDHKTEMLVEGQRLVQLPSTPT